MSLAELTPGFADAVHDAQRCFRVLLDAMSRPGRILPLPAETLAALQPPPGLGAGLAAVLLTVLDGETRVALLGHCDSEGTRHWLRFHTGVACSADVSGSAFAAGRAADIRAGLWSQLPRGTDPEPQLGATLVIEVPALVEMDSRESLVLRGPGIADVQRLRVDGLPRSFWAERIALERDRPRGVELVLVAGDRIAAIPRSTHLGWAD